MKYKTVHFFVTWGVGIGALVVGYWRNSLSETPLVLSVIPGLVMIGLGEALRHSVGAGSNREGT